MINGEISLPKIATDIYQTGAKLKTKPCLEDGVIYQIIKFLYRFLLRLMFQIRKIQYNM